MKKSKLTEEQVAFAVRQADLGTPVAEVCRKMGVAEATVSVGSRGTAAEAHGSPHSGLALG